MDQVSTTEDTIYQGRLRLLQPSKGYRFGSDAMLLAASARGEPGQKLMELGCGVGAVLLAAASRLTSVSFTGIEREAGYAALAEKNVTTNGMGGRVEIITGDLHDKELFHRLGTFDHVISNPPYYESHSSSAIQWLRRVARQEADTGIAGWLQAANRFLKPNGTITLIYPVERLQELLDTLSRFAGGITVFPLWPQQDVQAKRMLVTAKKSSRAPLIIKAGLVLHQADGTLTEAAHAIINEGQGLVL